MNRDLIKKYEKFYGKNKNKNLYPSEYLVRIFLSQRNKKKLKLKKYKNKKILDLSFGDGRNLNFFNDLGFNVYGTEISKKIIDYFDQKKKFELRVGKAHSIPFDDNFFDIIVASNSCYYLDKNITFKDNLCEINRVLKKDGVFICNVPNVSNYYFKNSIKLSNNEFLIKNDYLKLRNNYKLAAFEDEIDLKKIFKKFFKKLNIGLSNNNYWGINEFMYLIVSRKK